MTDDAANRSSQFTIRNGRDHRLHVTGELDLATAATLSNALRPHIARGGIIELDFTDMAFMDSSGVHVLCDAARLVGERGRIVVIRPPPIVRRLLEISGLVGVVELVDERPPAPTPSQTLTALLADTGAFPHVSPGLAPPW